MLPLIACPLYAAKLHSQSFHHEHHVATFPTTVYHRPQTRTTQRNFQLLQYIHPSNKTAAGFATKFLIRIARLQRRRRLPNPLSTRSRPHRRRCTTTGRPRPAIATRRPRYLLRRTRQELVFVIYSTSPTSDPSVLDAHNASILSTYHVGENACEWFLSDESHS